MRSMRTAGGSVTQPNGLAATLPITFPHTPAAPKGIGIPETVLIGASSLIRTDQTRPRPRPRLAPGTPRPPHTHRRDHHDFVRRLNRPVAVRCDPRRLANRYRPAEPHPRR